MQLIFIQNKKFRYTIKFIFMIIENIPYRHPHRHHLRLKILRRFRLCCLQLLILAHHPRESLFLDNRLQLFGHAWRQPSILLRRLFGIFSANFLMSENLNVTLWLAT
jgi:hypothetical protein